MTTPSRLAAIQAEVALIAQELTRYMLANELPPNCEIRIIRHGKRVQKVMVMKTIEVMKPELAEAG